MSKKQKKGDFLFHFLVHISCLIYTIIDGNRHIDFAEVSNPNIEAIKVVEKMILAKSEARDRRRNGLTKSKRDKDPLVRSLTEGMQTF